MKVHIRWMIRRDMPSVLGIEQQCFEAPWREEEFIRCLRQRNCIGMVVEDQSKPPFVDELGDVPTKAYPIVGFIIYELLKHKLHILNLAVHVAARRQQVGSRIMEKMRGKLSSQRRTRLVVEVRETNTKAQVFFAKTGFRCTQVLHDFYDDSDEDAYLFEYLCPECVEA